jgi:hypothetical protein
VVRILLIAVFASLPLVSCRPLPRYIVTTSPIDVVGVGHPGLCVAVDPTDPKGVWWWEPGRSGCSSRSTGPSAFRGDNGKVVATTSGAMNVNFELQLMVSGPRDVALVLQDGTMQVARSGQRVPTERHGSIEVPEQPPYR